MIFMGMYRKKPVTIEARRFITNNEAGDKNMNELVEWMNKSGQPDRYPRLADSIVARHDGTDIYIITLEGEHKATVGDWIIKGVKGEFYPCKPDIFKETYESAE